MVNSHFSDIMKRLSATNPNTNPPKKNTLTNASNLLLDPPGSEFVFYKVTRPKSCNMRTHFLAGRVADFRGPASFACRPDAILCKRSIRLYDSQ